MRFFRAGWALVSRSYLDCAKFLGALTVAAIGSAIRPRATTDAAAHLYLAGKGGKQPERETRIKAMKS